MVQVNDQQDLIDADYENALEQAESDLTLDEYYELRAAGGEEYDAAVEDISQFVGEMVENGPVGQTTSSLNRETRVKKLSFPAMMNTGIHRHCFRI
ncbi:hypothetical protein [Jeotgalicoccus sp. WY2]|uniref:hypothetical protein n=1 Tax=Jeotgalicoccus sp. WY2 TaxID=2708346 RepID=UPI001BD6B438|nr:hypothetical protein [Jeotgalicoccus sp. WY2]